MLRMLSARNARTSVIDRRDGRGGADRIAAARPAREIELERLVVEALEKDAQRRIVRQRLARERAILVAIVFQRLEIKFALVAERRIEARPVHAGRRDEIVERGSGIAGLPERVGGARERGLRVVGARPAAPFRLVFFLFFCTISQKILDAAHFMRNSTKIK